MEQAQFTFWPDSEAFLAKLLAERHRMSTSVLRSLERFLLRALSLVRISLNGACPVNRIPPELLEHIFEHVLDPERPWQLFDWPSSKLRSTRRLTTLTQVCHHWREICINCPSLWTYIVDIPRGSLQSSLPIFLTRSKSAPLKVLLTETCASFMDDLLQSNSTRIQELRMRSFSKTRIHLSLDFGAPALEQLTIIGNDQTSSDFRPVLFRGNAPRLKVLTLHTSWLPNNRFGSLKHLFCHHLVSVPVVRRQYYPSRDLVTFLSGCPSLEDIILIFPRLPVPERSASDDLPGATLSRLKRLVLDGSAPDWSSWFLRHITMPAGVSIRIFRTTIHGAAVLVRVLSHLVVGYDFTTLGMRWSGTPEDGHIVVTAANVHTGIRLEVGNIQYWRVDEISRTLCALFPQVNFRELYVDVANYGLPDFHAAELFSTFNLSLFPSLSKLVYRHHSCLPAPNPQYSLLHSLLYLLPTRTGTPPRCPGLAILHAHLGTSRPMFDNIIHFSDSRANAGYPLREVVIGYDGEAIDGTALERCVETVKMRADGILSQPHWPTSSTAARPDYWTPW